MSTIIDAVDTYYAYIRQQMATASGTVFINGVYIPQPFAGIVDAQDWPQAPFVEGGLYLLMVASTPGNMGTASQTEYICHLQWVWEIMGTDLSPMHTGRNRGDRWRAHMQVMENLKQAHYPGFTQKMTVTTDGAGNVSMQAATSEVPYTPRESIRWTMPRFTPKSDPRQTGMIYGAAEVELSAYTDVAAVLA